MDNRPIGFLDSGVGGLTVIKEVFSQLPNESIVYIGDSARAPYGPRTVKEILSFTWEMVHFLLSKNVKMIVMACNTTTANCLDEIKKQLNIPIIGVILPGALAAIQKTKINKIGVIGTQATVSADTYAHTIKSEAPNIEVLSFACPKFVPLVEKNELKSSETTKIVSDSLQPLIGKVDTLVLGCTHYPLLKSRIQAVMGQDVALIDSGVETVHDITVLLNYLKIENEPSGNIYKKYYTTGDVSQFRIIAEQWLNEKVDVKNVSLTKKSLVIATRNEGKIREFKKMFSSLGYTIKSLNDFSNLPDIEETGQTFEENARLKAETIAELTKEVVIGDDSGLCVDVLGGLPGIWSHRFSGTNPTDTENNAKLLHELASTEATPERRTAHFHTTLVAARHNHTSLVVDADWQGRIAIKPQGEDGFGYDPLFLVGNGNKTAAELSMEEKNKISHRGLALQKLLEELPAWLDR